MNLKRSILGISTLLLIAGMLGCSEDDKGPSYATCPVAETETDKCMMEKWGSEDAAELAAEQFVMQCYLASPTSTEEQIVTCAMNKVVNEIKPCVEKSGICDGADMSECLEHFRKECPDEFDF